MSTVDYSQVSLILPLAGSAPHDLGPYAIPPDPTVGTARAGLHLNVGLRLNP